MLGHPDQAIAMRKRFDALLTTLGPVGAIVTRRQFWPLVAYGMALKGDFKGAHALVDKTPADCDQCLRARGAIDALEKNWGGAEYWLARAARDAPTPPFVWNDWGRMLVQKGDYEAAIARLKLAHEKGPHFADPIEYWGEALMKKGRSDLALAKFEEANRYAPNWGRLHLNWGAAKFYSGDKAGAAREFAIASRLDLSPEEKSQLSHLQVSHGG
jgi:tetratricopeptide (TPR) repeat protein